MGLSNGLSPERFMAFYPFIPFPGESHHSVVMAAGVATPYIPPGAKSIQVQALTQNVRYTTDGTTPTASLGFRLTAAALPLVIPIMNGVTPRFAYETNGAVLEYEIGA